VDAGWAQDDATTRTAAALGAWNDIVAETFAGCVVDAPARPFDGVLRICPINDLRFVLVRAERSCVRRWLRGGPPRRSGTVLLHLQASGLSVNCQRGAAAAIGPGEAALCDPDHAYEVDFSTRYEMFVIELPLPRIVDWEPGFDLDRAAAQPVDRARSQLLLAFLRAAWAQADCLGADPDWRDCVSRTSLDLALRAISRAAAHTVVGASAELRRAVLDHIRRNLPEPELGTASIARALRISPRSVQTVFERLGTTASGFILEQRLDRAAEQLVREPGRRAITALAFDCGFSDPAYFSRCFRRRFGLPPRAHRAARAARP